MSSFASAPEPDWRCSSVGGKGTRQGQRDDGWGEVGGETAHRQLQSSDRNILPSPSVSLQRRLQVLVPSSHISRTSVSQSSVCSSQHRQEEFCFSALNLSAAGNGFRKEEVLAGKGICRFFCRCFGNPLQVSVSLHSRISSSSQSFAGSHPLRLVSADCWHVGVGPLFASISRVQI